ncbi:ATP-binding cassette domain-containing protein [Fundicoccus culcitae]|uniref:ABC transporter ATP-binding protein n=1 Tax=Fundicoccus culcitae TaxID=2969821 RepID=A0ABY5P7J9_9LACT|nr:ABC transporter ATP-binding protein [Fundicoccus culcitae]UUX34475.1 ABC transporter ATP-binding protein [Fundicoccus culcitae]
MLIINTLDLKTDFPLVNNISFSLEPRSIVGLVGPNGSGKSTLMRTIAGLRNEKNGFAQLKQKNHDLTPIETKSKIFYFESTNWFNSALSGMDYLYLINEIWHTDRYLIDEIINHWQLNSFIHKPISKYSLGMKQKTLLSLYHVSNADYFLFDEPTLALDKDSAEKFKIYLIRQKEKGKCIFFSAHENEDFFKICDKIYAIYEQNLIQLSMGGSK